MRLPGDKRIYILATAVVVVALVAFWWLVGPRRLSPEEAATRMQNAGSRLASEGGEVSVSVDVVMPEGFGETQSFEGDGTVGFDSDTATLTYDFSHLLNAAGAFGALAEFDVVFDGDTVYVEIFESGQPWISFQPAQSARNDVERLRELVLASPLVLPDLLQQSDSVSGIVSGEEVHLRGTAGPAQLIEAARESSSAMFPLLEELAISEVPIEVRLVEKRVSIDYEFAFAKSPGGPARIVVEVSSEFRPGQAPSIDVPTGSEVRDFEGVFG